MTCVLRAVGGWGRAQGGRNGGLLPGSGGGIWRRARICYRLLQAWGRQRGLWDAPRLGLMCVEAGRLSALVAARRWAEVRGAAARAVCGGEHLEIRCCVGLAGAVEELLDEPASPAAGRELNSSVLKK